MRSHPFWEAVSRWMDAHVDPWDVASLVWIITLALIVWGVWERRKHG